MKYTPEKNKTAKWISMASFLVALVLISTLFVRVRFQVFYELLALIFYLISFDLLYRYVLVTYTYIMEDGNFIVIKRTGRKEVCVCNLVMNMSIALVKTPKTGAEKAEFAKRFGKMRVRYNFCQVINPQNAYSYLLVFGEGTAEIVFQPNEEMLAAIEAELARINRSNF